MVVPIRLPDMGTNVEECKLLNWRVQVGDPVKSGQVLADIETDRAVAELESTAEGVLLSHSLAPGSFARTGDVLAYVGQPGECAPLQTAATQAADTAVQTGEAGKGSTPIGGADRQPPSRVSPIVRNLAAKLGVDLARVVGTGAGGIITREDVLLASRSKLDAGDAGEPLSRTQAAVASAVVKSWREIPHFHISATLDMSAVQRIRGQVASKEDRLSYDAIFLKAMARALQAVPRVASRLVGDRVVRAKGCAIAVAIGIGDELFMPVIRDVDQKDLRKLQAEIVRLTAKTKAGALQAEDLTGGCIALTNLGMFPVDEFDPIIFPDHSAILSVGATQMKPAAVKGRLETRPLATVTLAADHRLINGRTAAEFLMRLKEIIEAGKLS